MAKRVRLVDIAKRLHISKVSVSKALRDHPDISKETRKLVKKTAAELGYSPNLLARSLSAQKTNTLSALLRPAAHGRDGTSGRPAALEEVDALDGGRDAPKPRNVVLQTEPVHPTDDHGVDGEAGVPVPDAAPKRLATPT